MRELVALFEKYNFIRYHDDWPVGIIANIEDQTGFMFPEDYLYFIMNYRAFEGMIECEYVVLWDAENLLEMNESYKIMEFCPGIFAIGGNGAGECIAIDLESGGNHRLVLTDLIGVEKEYFVEIGSSFSDMLMRLNAGKGWFD